MTLRLPAWLPPVVVMCVAVHFPLGDEDAERRAADAWSDKAEWCREQAEYHEAKAQPSEGSHGETVAAIADKHRRTAERFRQQATNCDSLARQLYESANATELQKMVIISMAVILALQLARCALMFAAGGPIQAAIAQMATRTAAQRAWMRFVAFLSGRGAELAAERGSMVLLRNGVLMGVTLGGGTQAAAQAIQVAKGDRERMDWKSVGVATAAGGVGGALGMLFGLWAGPKVATIGANANSTAGRVALQLAGTTMVGAGAGAVGALGGTAVSLALSDQPFSRKAFTEGLIPGMGSGFLGAAAFAAQGMRSRAPLPDTTAAPAVAPDVTRAEASPGSLVDALRSHGIVTADFDPNNPSHTHQQQQIDNLVALLSRAGATADAPAHPALPLNNADWQPANVPNVSPDNLNPVKSVKPPSDAVATPADPAPAGTTPKADGGNQPPDVSPPKEYKPRPEQPFSVPNNSMDWEPPAGMPGALIDNVNPVKTVTFPAAAIASTVNPVGVPSLGTDPASAEAPGSPNAPAARSDSEAVGAAAAPVDGELPPAPRDSNNSTAENAGTARQTTEHEHPAAGPDHSVRPHPTDTGEGSVRPADVAPGSAHGNRVGSEKTPVAPHSTPEHAAVPDNAAATARPHPGGRDTAGEGPAGRGRAVADARDDDPAGEGPAGRGRAVADARSDDPAAGPSAPVRQRGVAADEESGPQPVTADSHDASAQPSPVAAATERQEAQQAPDAAADPAPTVSELVPAEAQKDSVDGVSSDRDASPTMTIVTDPAPAPQRGDPGQRTPGGDRLVDAAGQQRQTAQPTGGPVRPAAGAQPGAPAAGGPPGAAGGNRPPRVSAPKNAAAERPPAVEPVEGARGHAEDGSGPPESTTARATKNDNRNTPPPADKPEPEHGRADGTDAKGDETARAPHPETEPEQARAVDDTPPAARDEDPAAAVRANARAEVEQRIAGERQQNELVREHHRQRVDAAAERERAAHAELQRQEKAVRVAVEHERATRVGFRDEIRDLFGRGTAEDRVAVEAARAAQEQLRQAQSRLAECRDAYEAAVAQHDAAAQARARDLVEISDNAGVSLMNDYEAGVLTDRDAVFEMVAQERVRAALDAGRAIGELRKPGSTADGTSPLAKASPESLADTMVRGSREERVAAMTEWIRRGDDRHRLVRETQAAAFLLLEHGPVDMKTGEGKTIVMVMKKVSDAIDHGTAHAWTSSDLLAGELAGELHAFVARPESDTGIDVVRMDQDGPLPDPVPGRSRIVVGTKEDYLFRALKVADSMMNELAASGMSHQEVTALRDFLNTKPSIDLIKERLDAAASDHGLDVRYDPFPAGKLTVDEFDTIFDGNSECVLSPGAAEEAPPEVRAELQGIWNRLTTAEREHGLTAADFKRPEHTRGMWAAETTPAAVAKLEKVAGGPVTASELKLYADAANARWGLEKGTHYITRADEGEGAKIGILAHETNDKAMWDRTKWTEVRWQDVGQFVDLKEGLPVRANQEHSLRMSDQQLIGSKLLFDPSGLSGTMKGVEGITYDLYGVGPVPELPTFYASQRVVEPPKFYENTHAKLTQLARDIVRDAHVVDGEQTGRAQWVVCMDNGEIRGDPDAGRIGLIDLLRAAAKEEHGEAFELKFEVVDADFYAEHGGSNAGAEALVRQKIEEFGDKGTIYITNKDGGRGADPTPSQEVIDLGGVDVKVSGGPSYSERVNDQVDGRGARGGSGDDREHGGTPGSAVHYVSPEDFLGRVTDHGVTQQIVQYTEAVKAHRTALEQHEALNTEATRIELNRTETALQNAESDLWKHAVPAMKDAVEQNQLASKYASANQANAPPTDAHGTATRQPQHPPPQSAGTAAAHATGSHATSHAAAATHNGTFVPTAAGLAAGAASNLPSGNPPVAPKLRDEHGDSTLRHLLQLLDAPGGQAAAPLLPVAQAVRDAAFDQVESQGLPIGTDVADHLRETARNLLDTSLNQLDPAQRQLVTDAGTTLQQGRRLEDAHTAAVAQLVAQVPTAQPILAAAAGTTVPFDQLPPDNRTEILQRAQRGDQAAAQTLDRHFGPATAQAMCAVLSGNAEHDTPPTRIQLLAHAVARATLGAAEAGGWQVPPGIDIGDWLLSQARNTWLDSLDHLNPAVRRLVSEALDPRSRSDDLTDAQIALFGWVAQEIAVPATDSTARQRQPSAENRDRATSAKTAATDRKIKQAIARQLFETFGIEVLGLDKPGISVDTALSIRNAIVDGFAAGQELELDVVLVAPMVGNTGACIWTPEGIEKDAPTFMVLNENLFGDPEKFRNAMRKAVQAGHLMAPTGDPAYDSVSHEMGHLQDRAARKGLYDEKPIAYLRDGAVQGKDYEDSKEARAFGFLFTHFAEFTKAGMLPPDLDFDDWLGQLDSYSRSRKKLKEAEENNRILAGEESQGTEMGTYEPKMGDLAVFNPAEALAEANNAFGRTAPADRTHPAYVLQALLRDIPYFQVLREAEQRNALVQADHRGPVPAASEFGTSIASNGPSASLAARWRAMSPTARADYAQQQIAYLNPDSGFVLDELARLQAEHRATVASTPNHTAQSTETSAPHNNSSQQESGRPDGGSAFPPEFWQQHSQSHTRAAVPAPIHLSEPDEPGSRGIPEAEMDTALPEFSGLTGRELDILRMSARGLSYREISAEMGIPYSQLYRHAGSACAKLGRSSLVRAVFAADQKGWLDDGADDTVPHVALTPPEVAILRLAADGLSAHNIATRLGMNRYRVRNFLAELPGRFDTTGRIPAMLAAHRQGSLEIGHHNPSVALDRVALSPRERQVLDLMVAGLPDRAISDELGMPVTTARGHRFRLQAKLGTSDLEQIKVLAGLLPVADEPRPSDLPGHFQSALHNALTHAAQPDPQQLLERATSQQLAHAFHGLTTDDWNALRSVKAGADTPEARAIALAAAHRLVISIGAVNNSEQEWLAAALVDASPVSVREALDRLTPTQRELITSRYARNVPPAQLAPILGYDDATFDSWALSVVRQIAVHIANRADESGEHPGRPESAATPVYAENECLNAVTQWLDDHALTRLAETGTLDERSPQEPRDTGPHTPTQLDRLRNILHTALQGTAPTPEELLNEADIEQIDRAMQALTPSDRLNLHQLASGTNSKSVRSSVVMSARRVVNYLAAEHGTSQAMLAGTIADAGPADLLDALSVLSSQQRKHVTGVLARPKSSATAASAPANRADPDAEAQTERAAQRMARYLVARSGTSAPTTTAAATSARPSADSTAEYTSSELLRIFLPWFEEYQRMQDERHPRPTTRTRPAPDRDALRKVKATFAVAVEAAERGDPRELDRLRTAIRQLGNPRQERCLELRYLEGRSIPEIAAVLDENLSRGAAEQLHRRAVRALAAVLEQDHTPDEPTPPPATLAQAPERGIQPGVRRSNAPEEFPDPDDFESINDWLRELRHHYRMKQSEFAELCDRSVTTIVNYEKGRSRPDITLLRRLRDRLRFSNDSLIAVLRRFPKHPNSASRESATHPLIWEFIAARVGSAIEAKAEKLIVQEYAWIAEQLASGWDISVEHRAELMKVGEEAIAVALRNFVPPGDFAAVARSSARYAMLRSTYYAPANRNVGEYRNTSGNRTDPVAIDLDDTEGAPSELPSAGDVHGTARASTEKPRSETPPRGKRRSRAEQLVKVLTDAHRDNRKAFEAGLEVLEPADRDEVAAAAGTEQAVVRDAEKGVGEPDVISRVCRAADEVGYWYHPDGPMAVAAAAASGAQRPDSDESVTAAHTPADVATALRNSLPPNTPASDPGTRIAPVAIDLDPDEPETSSTPTPGAPRIHPHQPVNSSEHATTGPGESPRAGHQPDSAESREIEQLRALRDAVAARLAGAVAVSNDSVLTRAPALIDELVAARRRLDARVPAERLRLLEQFAHQMSAWSAGADEAAEATAAYEQGLREGTPAVLRARQDAAEIRLGSALAAVAEVWARTRARTDTPIVTRPAEHLQPKETERLRDVAETIFAEMVAAGAAVDTVVTTDREQLAEATRRYDALRDMSQWLEELLTFAEQWDTTRIGRERLSFLLDHFRAISELLAATKMRDAAAAALAGATDRERRLAQAAGNYGVADRGVRALAEMLGEPQQRATTTPPVAQPGAPVVWPGADGQPDFIAQTQPRQHDLTEPGPGESASPDPTTEDRAAQSGSEHPRGHHVEQPRGSDETTPRRYVEQNLTVEDLGTVAAASDRGRHAHNEDAFALIRVNVGSEEATALIVNDGLSRPKGGHRASAAAKAAAHDFVVAALRRAARDGTIDPVAVVEGAVAAAQEAVLALPPESPADKPPATTIVVALMESGRLTVDWVGDSRAYWIPLDGGPPIQLTRDDSKVQDVLDVFDDTTREEAEHSAIGGPGLTHNLGRSLDGLKPREKARDMRGDGVVLALTDGVWEPISPDDPEPVAAIVRRSLAEAPGDLGAVTRALVRAGIEAGTDDDVTAAAGFLSAANIDTPANTVTDQDGPATPADRGADPVAIDLEPDEAGPTPVGSRQPGTTAPQNSPDAPGPQHGTTNEANTAGSVGTPWARLAQRETPPGTAAPDVGVPRPGPDARPDPAASEPRTGGRTPWKSRASLTEAARNAGSTRKEVVSHARPGLQAPPTTARTNSFDEWIQELRYLEIDTQQMMSDLTEIWDYLRLDPKVHATFPDASKPQENEHIGRATAPVPMSDFLRYGLPDMTGRELVSALANEVRELIEASTTGHIVEQEIPDNVRIAYQNVAGTLELARIGSTRQEFRVLTRLVQGKTYKETAAELEITPWAVQRQARSIYAEFGIEGPSALEAAIRARHADTAAEAAPRDPGAPTETMPNGECNAQWQARFDREKARTVATEQRSPAEPGEACRRTSRKDQPAAPPSIGP
ncbi:LuxR C-terminal-related transcriptional regulator [Nocardia sp. R7R-8]|uniref:LuxR C-terminal-related transcriptional regulator n=1 Tax=Nocardia sp. R7R-8 TaxID=3459304 RepID=UPI00403E2F8D